MRLLDLFCGAGGAAVGYHRAGFEVVGVDLDPQPFYPFAFVQADALRPAVDLAAFDLIHASPPCQRFSTATRDAEKWPDLVAPIRAMLEGSGVPWIIENVLGAPVRRDVVLCGSMFGLQVQRHRAFEVSEHWPLILTPPHRHHEWPAGRPYTVTGDGGACDTAHSLKPTRDHARELMGMPWALDRRGVIEAIPPAYTEWLAQQFCG